MGQIPSQFDLYVLPIRFIPTCVGQILPEAVRGVHLYEPSENGYEKEIRTRLYRLTGDERYTQPEQLLERENE